jgi:hypothetical protein
MEGLKMKKFLMFLTLVAGLIAFEKSAQAGLIHDIVDPWDHDNGYYDENGHWHYNHHYRSGYYDRNGNWHYNR